MLSLLGCSNPTGPSGSNSGGGGANSGPPVTETLWENGNLGTWFGNLTVLQVGNTMPVNAAVTDTLTGDPTTLLISTNNQNVDSHGFSIFTPNEDPNASSVLQGHLQFDIMLASAWTGPMTVSYASNVDESCFWTVVNLAGLSNAVFTHISIPASAFTTTPGCSASTTLISEPLYIIFPTAPINTNLVYLNDIQWTSY